MKVIKSLENRTILLKRTQKGGFLNFYRPLVKSVLIPLAENVLIPLRLSAGMSAADAAIQKKIYGSGTTALKISNEEMEHTMKIVKLLEELGLLIKGIYETLKNE